jgi:serine/threonine-protein kinase
MRFCASCGLLYGKGHRICPLDGTTLEERKDPYLGQVVAGKYRILELIGMGGVGRVYKARHVHMDRRVAVKLLPEEASVDSEVKERFIREARAADMVRHENIVEILDLGETGEGVPYMIMELLEGHQLEDVIALNLTPLDRAVHIMRQICSVLGPTHAMGIVHRDLKPENVFLIERNGRSDFVKILDFGVAHLAHEPGITKDNMVLGTPQYIAPEVATGRKPGPPDDLYAVGCMGFEMVAGKSPFDADSIFEIMQKHITEPAPRLGDRHPDVPEPFEAIVSRLLQKDPADRYPDAYAVMRDLDLFMPPVRQVRDPALRLSTPGFVPGTPLEPTRLTMTPDILNSWKDFTWSALGRASDEDRRVVYEMEELSGKLESLFGMQESILTVMNATEEKARRTGRHIRFAIDRIASNISLRRTALSKEEIADLELKIGDLRGQLETLGEEQESQLAEHKSRLEQLETEREVVEAQLCELSMRLGGG